MSYFYLVMDQQDEWNSFLDEVEGKEKDSGTLIRVGDIVPSSITLYRVPHSPHTTTAADDGASKAETLEDILTASQNNATLLVLNRHFA